MPCVHLKTYGPESAGDDAALIQRKASFDTRRADRAHSARLVDGAGWRGRWTWPTSQGVRFSSFTLGLMTRNTTQRGGMVTSRVSYARRSPVSTERCDWGRAGRPERSYQPSASGSAPGAPTIWPP